MKQYEILLCMQYFVAIGVAECQKEFYLTFISWFKKSLDFEGYLRKTRKCAFVVLILTSSFNLNVKYIYKIDYSLKNEEVFIFSWK